MPRAILYKDKWTSWRTAEFYLCPFLQLFISILGFFFHGNGRILHRGILGPELLEEYSSFGGGGYGYLGFVQGDSPEEIVFAVSKPETLFDIHDVKIRLVYVDYHVVTIEVGGSTNTGILLAGLGVALILGLTLWKGMRAKREGSTTPTSYR